ALGPKTEAAAPGPPGAACAPTSREMLSRLRADPRIERRNEKMDVLMIAPFADVAGNSNNRFNTVASVLGRLGADVELVTSSFSHTVKRQGPAPTARNPLYRTTCVREPGYPTTAPIRRLLSHRALGRNLTAYPPRRRRPDV